MTFALRLALAAAVLAGAAAGTLLPGCSRSSSISQSGLDTLDAGSGSGPPPVDAPGGPGDGGGSGSGSGPDASTCTSTSSLVSLAVPPALPDFAGCVMNLEATATACEAACEMAHPLDVNPDPQACPDGYSGPGLLAREMCINACDLAFNTSYATCCSTAGVGGKPIDLGGTSEEAASCNKKVCWQLIHALYGACFETYADHVGHDLGNPCAIDAFGHCDGIFNAGPGICTASWRPSWCGSTACGVPMPCALDNWIAQLGDPSYSKREAAQALLIAELDNLLRSNPSQLQCLINKIRERFKNHPSISDAEVAERLKQIWAALVHEAPGSGGVPEIPAGCPAPPPPV